MGDDIDHLTFYYIKKIKPKHLILTNRKSQMYSVGNNYYIESEHKELYPSSPPI
jgi:hypothetical protein